MTINRWQQAVIDGLTAAQIDHFLHVPGGPLAPIIAHFEQDPNVVELPAVTGSDAGCVVTLKSDACVPLIATFGVPVKSNEPLPVFWIVNVRANVFAVSTVPKSV